MFFKSISFCTTLFNRILGRIRRYIYFVIGFVADCCYALLFYNKKPIGKRTLLVIKVDAIGDYVLFRNFLELIKTCDVFKDYELTLLGNEIWRPLAETFDGKSVNNFIWINEQRFQREFLYRIKKMLEISELGYETVLQPTYSRFFLREDSIVRFISAQEKIGSAGDCYNMHWLLKKISDRFYSRLIKADAAITFEYMRNMEFFENLTGLIPEVKHPHLDLPVLNCNLSLPENYAVIFVGASVEMRKWKAERFALIGRHLKDCFGLDILLCGGNGDIDDGIECERCFGSECKNLVGKTSLLEFVNILKTARVLVSNETSAVHFAVAVETKYIFVISNGNHFGRFTPYPESLVQNYHAIYPSIIEANRNNRHRLIQKYGMGSNLDINSISVESVLMVINSHLKTDWQDFLV